MVQSKFCSQCGAQNNLTARNCHNCGGPIGVTALVPVPLSPAVIQQPTGMQPYGNAQGAHAQLPQVMSATVPMICRSLDVMQHTDGTAQILIGTQIIGRDVNCQIVLASPNVSRRHAQIQVIVFGNVVLTDLGSSGGTQAGYILRPPHQPISLQPNARIRFGDVQFQYCTQAPHGLLPASAHAPLELDNANAVGTASAVMIATQKLPLSMGRVLSMLSVVVVALSIMSLGLLLAIPTLFF